MRLHDPLDDILGSRIKVRILRLLFRTRGLFSGREVSRQIGFSPTHTISALRELEALGLVLRQRAGNTDLYQLDDQNSSVESVLAPIFGWESNLFNELAQMFVGSLGNALVSLRLFGSTARGDEGPGSDVDLLITLARGSDPDSLERLISEVDLEAGRKLGCPVSSISVTEDEYAKKVKGKKGFWKDIPRESKVIYERDGQESGRVPKKINTREVSRSAAANYLAKARQFSRAMIDSLRREDWDAAGLGAVHCAISGNDAVLVLAKGVRSAGSRHEDSVALLESLIAAPGVKNSVSQLKRLVAKKNVIEYEDRMFRESEAREAVKSASRFLKWAETQFSP